MAGYGPYWVGQFTLKPGMEGEAIRWWVEKGEPDIRAELCTKSLKAYSVQFMLGERNVVEIWQELENYAILDKMQEDIVTHPENYSQAASHLREAHSFIEWGAARLMRAWPP